MQVHIIKLAGSGVFVQRFSFVYFWNNIQIIWRFYITFSAKFFLKFVLHLRLKILFIQILIEKRRKTIPNGILFQFQIRPFCFEKARQIVHVWGPNSVVERTMQRWFQKFRSGDLSLEDDRCSGQPKPILDNDLKVLVEADSPQTSV